MILTEDICNEPSCSFLKTLKWLDRSTKKPGKHCVTIVSTADNERQNKFSSSFRTEVTSICFKRCK